MENNSIKLMLQDIYHQAISLRHDGQGTNPIAYRTDIQYLGGRGYTQVYSFSGDSLLGDQLKINKITFKALGTTSFVQQSNTIIYGYFSTTVDASLQVLESADEKFVIHSNDSKNRWTSKELVLNLSDSPTIQITSAKSPFYLHIFSFSDNETIRITHQWPAVCVLEAESFVKKQLGAPVISDSPEVFIPGDSYTFKWDTVTDATRYRYRATNLTTGSEVVASTEGTSFEIIMSSTRGSKGRFEVQAVNDLFPLKNSKWGKVEFTVNSLPSAPFFLIADITNGGIKLSLLTKSIDIDKEQTLTYWYRKQGDDWQKLEEGYVLSNDLLDETIEIAAYDGLEYGEYQTLELKSDNINTVAAPSVKTEWVYEDGGEYLKIEATSNYSNSNIEAMFIEFNGNPTKVQEKKLTASLEIANLEEDLNNLPVVVWIQYEDFRSKKTKSYATSPIKFVQWSYLPEIKYEWVGENRFEGSKIEVFAKKEENWVPLSDSMEVSTDLKDVIYKVNTESISEAITSIKTVFTSANENKCSSITMVRAPIESLLDAPEFPNDFYNIPYIKENQENAVISVSAGVINNGENIASLSLVFSANKLNWVVEIKDYSNADIRLFASVQLTDLYPDEYKYSYNQAGLEVSVRWQYTLDGKQEPIESASTKIMYYFDYLDPEFNFWQDVDYNYENRSLELEFSKNGEPQQLSSKFTYYLQKKMGEGGEYKIVAETKLNEENLTTLFTDFKEGPILNSEKSYWRVLAKTEYGLEVFSQTLDLDEVYHFPPSNCRAQYVGKEYSDTYEEIYHKIILYYEENVNGDFTTFVTCYNKEGDVYENIPAEGNAVYIDEEKTGEVYFEIATEELHGISTYSSNTNTIFLGEPPTVAYRSHHLGINTFPQTGNGVLEIQPYGDRQIIYLGDKAQVNLSTGLVTGLNFTLDGGTWDT